MSPPPFSLRRRVQLCLVMLALESFISFEEIFMLAVLQRVNVPTFLVSLPGTLSSFIGVFIIPLLGWAGDRSTCSACCGHKRPYAVFTLSVSVVGVCILMGVNLAALYGSSEDPNHANNSTVTYGSPTTQAAVPRSSNISQSLPKLGDSVFGRAWSAKPPVSELTEWIGNNQSFSSATDHTAQQQFANRTPPRNLSAPGPTVNDSAMSTVWKSESSSQSIFKPFTTSSSSVSLPTTDSVDSTFISFMGGLGIVGFTLSDHGYDSSMSTFKTYMTAVTPTSQHDDIFVLGTLTGAIGGCLTSLLGFVDLASLFHQSQGGAVLDKGVAQCLVQAGILLVELLVLGTCSFLTGSEAPTLIKIAPESSGSPTQESITDQSDVHLERASRSYGSLGNRSQGCETRSTDSNEDQETSLLRPSSNSTRNPSVWKRARRRIFLCIMAFLGLCTNYAYFVYVTNYVAEVIYHGDPRGQVDTEEYDNYVEGEHIASLGMLTFYCLFVGFNLLHNKILAKIGMRAEYLGASIACCVLMLTLAATDNIIVFFVNAVTMAAFRSAVYTIPFMLSNSYAQKEHRETQEGDENGSTSQTGVAMASISAMIPASYFVVSIAMGPLMDVSGYPGTPILFASASCALGIVSTCFVRFD